jgi:hypothetical protein
MGSVGGVVDAHLTILTTEWRGREQVEIEVVQVEEEERRRGLLLLPLLPSLGSFSLSSSTVKQTQPSPLILPSSTPIPFSRCCPRSLHPTRPNLSSLSSLSHV